MGGMGKCKIQHTLMTMAEGRRKKIVCGGDLDAAEGKSCGRFVEEDRSHELVVSRQVVFAEVVSMVLGTRLPKDVEVPLFDAIAHPVETHVHGFGPPLADGIVQDAFGACIVHLDGGCGLGMAEFG